MSRRIEMSMLQNLKDDQVYEENLIFPYAFKKSQIKMIKFTDSIQQRLIFPLVMSGNATFLLTKSIFFMSTILPRILT